MFTKRIKKIGIVVLLLVLVVVIGVGVSAYRLLLPVSPVSEEKQKFIVPKGQAITVIGDRLFEAGLIRHPLVFRFIVETNDLAQKIQAGTFELTTSMTPLEIAQELTTGTQDTWITLLEGWRAEEIAEYLSQQELEQFDLAEFLTLAKEDEGMLFPDTYLIPKEMNAQQIHAMLVRTFTTKVTQGLAKEIANSPYPFEDVIIMASLVQREAKTFEQMQHVAGILWNRIEIGMALQVDATMQYAKGYDPVQKKWWTVPMAIDRQINSPFNTYLHVGLPPRPIANPGLSAIKATLTPLAVDDLYYIHAPSGEMYYAATLEGHTANVNKYLR